MNPQFIIPLLFPLQELVGSVSGHLSINKQKVPLGEAIEIRVEAVNQGNRSIEITSGAPGTLCGNFKIKILQGRNIFSEIPAPEKGPDIIGSCLFGGKDIAPGKSFVESVWIGRAHEISKPGKYQIDVTYGLVYDKYGTLAGKESPRTLIHATFNLTVTK
jgi:hypothetical protein